MPEESVDLTAPPMPDIDAFIQLDADKKALKAATAENNKKIEALQAKFLLWFQQVGLKNVKSASGKTVYVHRRRTVVQNDATRAELVAYLWEHHKELVSANSARLTAFVVEAEASENGLDSKIADKVSLDEIFTARVRSS